MMRLVKLPDGGAAEWEDIAPGSVLAGQPRSRTWVHYEDAGQKLAAGEWEASPGKWRIAYQEWEYVLVLSGRCVIAGDDGSRIEAGPGARFVIEPGFTGSWEVLVPMRKQWVIRE